MTILRPTLNPAKLAVDCIRIPPVVLGVIATFRPENSQPQQLDWISCSGFGRLSTCMTKFWLKSFSHSKLTRSTSHLPVSTRLYSSALLFGAIIILGDGSKPLTIDSHLTSAYLSYHISWGLNSLVIYYVYMIYIYLFIYLISGYLQ